MSPQQMDGMRPRISDDIYSLGATLYQLLTSKPPFYGQGDIVWRLVHEKTAPTIAERRKDLEMEGEPIPPAWEETVAACLAKDPAQRPPSMREIPGLLGLDGEPVKILRNIPIAEPPPPKPKSSRLAKAFGVARARMSRKKVLIVGSVLVALTLAGVGYYRGYSPQAPLGIAALARTGRLEVTSDLDGVEISIDGQPKGKTPSLKKLEGLAPREHQVVARYENWTDTKTVAIKKGATSPCRFNFMSSVDVTGAPKGATVFQDGRKLGEAPLPEPVKVKPGRTKFEVKLDGYETWSQEMLVEPDKKVPLTVKLREKSQIPALGWVKLTSRPDGATVLKGGQPLGTTPWLSDGVPPGTVQYVIRLKGYQDEKIPVVVTANQTNVVEMITLEKATEKPPEKAPEKPGGTGIIKDPKILDPWDFRPTKKE